MHRYEVIEKVELKNEKDKITGIAYVSKCTVCGKIHTVYIPMTEEWIRSTRLLAY